MRRKLTKEDIKLVIDLYNNGICQREIAQQISCSQVTISNILRRAKVPTRIGKKITYQDVNYSFFKKINSEASAYFLGLLYADGCVQNKNNAYTVSLKLKSDDQMIIEKFRDLMSPSSPIKISDGKYSRFRINQKEICEQLISHGCVPNKSLILEFPKTIPNKLIRHFLRGYSDGDGSIYKNKLQKTFNSKPYTNIIWKIISTKQFCNQVHKILKEQLNINCSQSLSKPKTNQITTTLLVGGNIQVMKALDWLYQDATIYLPRKYEKYLEFKKTQSPSSKVSSESSSDIDGSSIISRFNKSLEPSSASMVP